MAWTSNFGAPWHYVPTSYSIIEFLENDQEFEEYWATEISPGHKWRAAIEELKVTALELSQNADNL